MRRAMSRRGFLCRTRHMLCGSTYNRKNAAEDAEAAAMGRIAMYPHRSLTRPVLPVSQSAVRSPAFSARLLDVCTLAKDVHCISFSAPKAHWDAAVVLIKNHPDDPSFDVWVNPVVPGYNDKHSVAPMYGMWENCVSCGSCNAWVMRPQRIVCSGWDQYGVEKKEILDGIKARCLMHELDHLAGRSILQEAVGSEFVVSSSAILQRDLWPVNHPSAEAYVTAPHQFFDYVHNCVVTPEGMGCFSAQYAHGQFDNHRLET